MVYLLSKGIAVKIKYVHYRDVKWASLNLDSPASRLFVQQFVQTDIKGYIEAPPNWLLRGQSTSDPHKGPAMRKAFPCHDVGCTSFGFISGSLTHWGRMMHICVSKLSIIGSDNGLSPDRRQAIIWTNAGILLIGTSGTNFNEILFKIHTFHSRISIWKCRLKNGVHFVSASIC